MGDAAFQTSIIDPIQKRYPHMKLEMIELINKELEKLKNKDRRSSVVGCEDVPGNRSSARRLSDSSAVSFGHSLAQKCAAAEHAAHCGPLYRLRFVW
jgi:hypothetical protein